MQTGPAKSVDLRCDKACGFLSTAALQQLMKAWWQDAVCLKLSVGVIDVAHEIFSLTKLDKAWLASFTET